MPLEDLAEKLAEVARELASEDVEHTLEKAERLAVDVVGACDAAGVTVVREKQVETPLHTEELARRGDELQHQLGEGPCLDAITADDLIVSRDLATEQRWPKWAPAVVEELGLRSLMCVQLFTSEQTVGALNMYSRQPDAFDEKVDRPEAQALAAHIAVALASAQEVEGLNIALTSRTVIGQAEGILMERFGLSAERAFQVLQRVSSHTNTKLRAVAEELVRTRQTPG